MIVGNKVKINNSEPDSKENHGDVGLLNRIGEDGWCKVVINGSIFEFLQTELEVLE